jgi:hypothetical protein
VRVTMVVEEAAIKPCLVCWGSHEIFVARLCCLRILGEGCADPTNRPREVP